MFKLSPGSWSGANWADAILGGLWLLIFVYNAWVEQRMVQLRYQRGELWHSFSCGELTLEIPRWIRFLFPALLVGAVAAAQFVPMALLLSSSFAVSVLMRAEEARRFRQFVLDTIDARFAETNLSKAVLERSRPRDTEGFQTPSLAHAETKYRKKFVQAAQPGSYPDLAGEPPAASPMSQSEVPV